MKATTIMPLNKAAQGLSYKVIDIRLKEDERKRIMDLGLIPHTTLKVLQKSPLGDPIAYFIRGTVIALRSECTKKIIVKKFKPINLVQELIRY